MELQGEGNIAPVEGDIRVGGFNRSVQHLLILLDEEVDMVTSRIWFTAKQKAELWERWKDGQSDAPPLPPSPPPLSPRRSPMR